MNNCVKCKTIRIPKFYVEGEYGHGDSTNECWFACQECGNKSTAASQYGIYPQEKQFREAQANWDKENPRLPGKGNTLFRVSISRDMFPTKERKQELEKEYAPYLSGELCDCECHLPGVQMYHIQACCENGIKFKK